MKPNDQNGKLPTSERPFPMLILSGVAGAIRKAA